MNLPALVLFGLTGLCLRAQQPAAFELTRTIPLPGVTGRFDHFAIDTSGHRLFVAALGNNTVEVVDPVAGRRLKSIAGMRKPQGVLYLTGSNLIGVANGGDGTLKLLDGSSYEPVKSLGSFEDADNLRFDPRAKCIYLGYGDGALGIIAPGAARPRDGIKLPAHPESFQLERQGSRIFVNLPDAQQVAVINRDNGRIIARWPMKQFRANFPMALDETTHRLFIGCRQPPRLAVLDTEAGALVAQVEISGDTDDLYFDSRRNRIYLSCGEGFLDTVQRRDGDRWERISRLPTRIGARTCLYNADLDHLYLAVPQRAGREAEIRVYQPR